jgi:phosphohistidine swiveling domain-containing protein
MATQRKSKTARPSDPWMLGEEIPDMDLFFSQIWISGFSNEFHKHIKVAYARVLAIFRGTHLWFYYGDQDSKRVGDAIVDRFMRQPAFAVRVNKEIIRSSDRLRAFAATLPTTGVDALSNRKLWDLYRRHDEIHTDYYTWGWIPVAVDMFHNNLTEKGKQYLRSIDVQESQVNAYLVQLTQPSTKSLIQIEQDDFLRLAQAIGRYRQDRRLIEAAKKSTGLFEKLSPSVQRLLERHWQKYFYVKFLWIGKEGVATREEYLQQLIDFYKTKENPARILRRQELRLTRDRVARKRLIKKLGIREPWRTLFDAWGDFMVTKIYRRYAQIYAIYRMQPVLLEIGRRCNLSLLQVRLMLKDEIRDALLQGRINRKSLRQRVTFCVYWSEPKKEEIILGARARQLARQVEVVDHGDVTEIHGQTGCVGKATGRVKIVIRPADMAKFKKGDVLVSIATDSDIVSAMKKAAAIVTEQGGVTSHAAIVSRELGVPCVIGTKIATKVLKDGDLVEVDATKGIVRKL